MLAAAVGQYEGRQIRQRHLEDSVPPRLSFSLCFFPFSFLCCGDKPDGNQGCFSPPKVSLLVIRTHPAAFCYPQRWTGSLRNLLPSPHTVKGHKPLGWLIRQSDPKLFIPGLRVTTAGGGGVESGVGAHPESHKHVRLESWVLVQEKISWLPPSTPCSSLSPGDRKDQFFAFPKRELPLRGSGDWFENPERRRIKINTISNRHTF